MKELIGSGSQVELDKWVQEFLTETSADLVVAGYAQTEVAGQTELQVFVYVPPQHAVDAAEIAGWYPLDPLLIDRNLGSARARQTVLGQLKDEFSGLATFLNGLDAWQAGYPAEASDDFGKVLDQVALGSGTTLEDLARLFRGHALETESQGAEPQRRARLLTRARNEYVRIPPTSAVQLRVRVSLATNDYLIAVEKGCGAATADTVRLTRSAAQLQGVANESDLPDVVLRKAQANLAQVDLCRWRSGDSSARAPLMRVLDELVDLRLPSEGANTETYRQVKALALSVQATRLALEGHRGEAQHAMAEALQLDPRFERQALWRGLRSGWLLTECQVKEGQAEQDRALTQLRAAVKAGRLPEADIDTYAAAFQHDRSRAVGRCPRDG